MKYKRIVLLWGLLIVIAIMVVNFYATAETIELSEVCSHNKAVICDTIGTYNDYVELHNATNTNIDLMGYALSDDKNELDKYVFGETSIEPGEYILLWACEPVEKAFIDDIAKYLGFSLKDGETVYLSDPSGRVIDRVTLPKLESDVSYARSFEGRDEWNIQQPSPGSENIMILDEKSDEICVASPRFSHPAGFYEDAFYLEITCEDGCNVYYTLDGTIPSLTSLKYDGPIYIKDVSECDNMYTDITDISLVSDYTPEYTVDKANVIRAVAIDEEGNESDEVTATFFVDFKEKHEYDNITVLSMVTDPDNLFDYEHGIYVTGKVYDSVLSMVGETTNLFLTPANYNREGKGWERKAHIEMFDQAGDMQFSQAIGIRIHGGWSTAFNQKSFNLYAQPDIDGQTTVFDGLFNQHESTMMLRTGGFRDWNLTKFRDVLNQFLVEDRDILTQSAIPCQLFLNGEYWGLYNIQEKVDASFVASNYGVDEENVIVLKNESIVSGEDEEYVLWQSLIDFAENNDLSKEDNYSIISEMMDIQSFIDYNCFQIYVANCDSVANNLARWRTREISDDKYCDGKWRWILYDTDDSAGMPIEGVDYAQYDVDTFIGGHWYETPLEETLFSALIRNEEFKKAFVVSFMDMANYHFDYETNVKSVIEDFYEKYAIGVVASHRRFRDANYSEKDYLQEVDLVKEFYSKRYQYITAYMKNDLGLEGELNNVMLKQDECGGRVYINTLELEEGENFEGCYYSDYSIKLRAVPSQGYEFAGWNVDDTMVSKNEEIELDMRTGHIVYPIWEVMND